MLSQRSIEKSQDKIIVDQNSVYHRDFVCGILHEKLYMLVCAAPFYPFTYAELYFDADKYPSKQVIKTLKDKHGRYGDEKYVRPSKLHIDCLDEGRPKNLEELHQFTEALQRRVDARCVTPNWERDFSRAKFNSSCIDGDQAFFKTAAESALDEGRCQVSATAKNLLSRDADALICFGLCVVAIEQTNPYTAGGGGRDFSSEQSLAGSYT